tara:strand:+ start:471 stop:641 length:171 start_codon:yes stop_codon:yes gene_type:complete
MAVAVPCFSHESITHEKVLVVIFLKVLLINYNQFGFLLLCFLLHNQLPPNFLKIID